MEPTALSIDALLTPFISQANETPWFQTMMIGIIAMIVLLLALAYASKIGIEILRNFGSMQDSIDKIKPHNKSLKTLALAEEEANEELDLLCRDYGADRACIMLFHNGKTSLGNVHMLSASIKAEGGSNHFPRIAGRVQSVPMSIYGHWTKSVITGHGLELPDCLSVASEQAPDAYMMLEQHSVKSLYVYPVVTPSGDIDGCIFVEYCQARRELGDTEKAAIRARGQSIYTKLHEANNV